MATVTIHEILGSGTADILTRRMAEPALTPELALDYLDVLSVDIRAAALLDSRGELAASTAEPADRDRMAALVRELFERAEAAALWPSLQLTSHAPEDTTHA